MATTIGTAYVQIEPTTDGISGKITEALGGEVESAGKSAGSKLSNALGSAAKIGVASVAALGSAAIATGTALTNSASATAQYGDNIDKMSQKLGVSSTFYQEWEAVMQHSGTSMESMGASFKKLATVSQNATDEQVACFARLGLSIDDIESMSTEDLFSNVVSGLQNMEEGNLRTATAATLLGKGATELGALFNTSAEDTQAMIDTVHELGGVMDKEAVKASAAFQDSLQDMQTSLTGVKNAAMSELLPGITEVMNGITALVTGTEGSEEILASGIESITQSITKALPTLITAFGTISTAVLGVAPELISTLAEGIISNIPTLVPTILKVVLEIGQALMDNLPALLSAGLEVIVQIAMGIAQSLPTLIPTIVDVVLNIVDTLIDNVDMLIDGAIALIIGLAEGLINALPKLIEKVPVIIVKLVSAFITNAPKLFEASLKLIVTLASGLIQAIPNLIKAIPQIVSAIVKGFKSYLSSMVGVGKDLVSGIWQGIKSAWSNLTSWLSDLCGDLVGIVKRALKIGSPSKLFRDEVGQWIPAGIAVGIEGNTDVLEDSMDVMQNALDPKQLDVDTSFASNYNNTSNNDGIIDLLNQYLPQLANMQIMLDSGTLVGATAPAMNSALGKISAREGYR